MDDKAHPLAVAMASETHPALLLSEGVPTVPRLLFDQGLALEGVDEAEAWRESWALGEVEGALLRSRIYPPAARRLFPAMGLEGVQDVVDQNSLNLGAVNAVGALVHSQAIATAINQARGFQSKAETALRNGEGEGALVLALRTADVLWEVSPQHVATDLIRRATDALGRKSLAVSYSVEELIRIRRLMHGASEALDEGDYPRAIRRAYYACQLLGADLP